MKRVMVVALAFTVAGAVFLFGRELNDGTVTPVTLPTSVTPDVRSGAFVDVIFDTSRPIMPDEYRSSIVEAEIATKGKTLQPDPAALPGPDKSPEVWADERMVMYRYGDDLVMEITPYGITTPPEEYMRGNADAFGGTFTTIAGNPAVVREAHSFEAFEKQRGDSTFVVGEEYVDTTLVGIFIHDRLVTLFGHELTGPQVVKIAASLS
jgi:hypothetical protein